MSYRKPISRRASRRLFSRTANRTLKVNNAPPATRGGIRL